MAQCKDCIHGEICDMFAHIRTLICDDRADKMCKMFKSTADVVPKSEVAREIFESIEECIYLYYNKNDYTMSNIEEDIVELKKKYMEGNNEIS